MHRVPKGPILHGVQHWWLSTWFFWITSSALFLVGSRLFFAGLDLSQPAPIWSVLIEPIVLLIGLVVPFGFVYLWTGIGILPLGIGLALTAAGVLLAEKRGRLIAKPRNRILFNLAVLFAFTVASGLVSWQFLHQ